MAERYGYRPGQDGWVASPEESDELVPDEEALLELVEEDDTQPNDGYLVDGYDPLGRYLREIAKIPLLTAQKEVTLAKRIEKGKEAVVQLDRNDGQLVEEEKQALKQSVADGEEAREALIGANTRLVVSIAKKYQAAGWPFWT